MVQGGKISESSRLVARLIGLLAPGFLMMYGYLVALGYVPSMSYWGHAWLIFLTSTWMAFGVWQYFFYPANPRRELATIIVHHTFGLLYLMSISGFSAFAVSLWSALIIASFVYYKTIGFVFSCMTLFIGAFMFLGIHIYDVTDATVVLLNLLATVLLSGVAIGFIASSHAKHSSLKTSPVSQSTDHQRLVTIINNLTDAVLVTDSKGVIELYNAAALNLLDTNANITKRNIDAVVKLVNSQSEPISLYERLVASKHFESVDEYSIPVNDGEEIKAGITFSPIRSTYKSRGNGGSEGFIVIIRDITKQKSLDEERDEFISVVSHELRTPITVAEGTLSNAKLLIERGKDTKKSIADTISEAHEQILFLASMINDLSTLSRAERGVAAESEPIDVRSFVHDLYNEYLPEAKKKKLHFNLDTSIHSQQIHTSRLYLHELLQNLITNAIKYTYEGKIVFSAHDRGDEIEFSVADEGIGISKADQTKIFKKFYRSEDYRTRETTGTGLGLYVAEKLAKLLRTTITVKSRLNHGSTFSIRIATTKEPTRR